MIAVVGAVAFLARAGLAVMFGMAGASKLANLHASRQSMLDFGVPSFLAGAVGVVIPLVEIVIAVALLPTSTAGWGATGALVLLLVFVVAVGVNLLRGRQPECSCFGQLHSEPISRWTLVRNLALSAVAAALVWRGWATTDRCALGCMAPDVVVWAVGFAAAGAAIGLIATQWWMFITLSRSYGQVLIRLQGLEALLNSQNLNPVSAVQSISKPAPAFRLPDAGGRMVGLEDLLAPGNPVFLVFSDPICPACGELMSDLASASYPNPKSVTMTIVSRGKDGDHGRLPVLLDATGATFTAYGVPGTPSAVVVRPDGLLETMASGAVAVRELWRRTAGIDNSHRPA